jgi:hypothetical protein
MNYRYIKVDDFDVTNNRKGKACRWLLTAGQAREERTGVEGTDAAPPHSTSYLYQFNLKPSGFSRSARHG